MRELPIDIIDEMKVRFVSEFNTANKILAEYLTENEYLDSDRIIRCVVFLTQSGIKNFEENLKVAKSDPRDVMFWAEYENQTERHPKRVRDFNKTFSENGV